MSELDFFNEFVDLRKRIYEIKESFDCISIYNLDHVQCYEASTVLKLAKKLNKKPTLVYRDKSDPDTIFPYLYGFEIEGIEVFAILTEYEKEQFEIEMKGEKTA